MKEELITFYFIASRKRRRHIVKRDDIIVKIKFSDIKFLILFIPMMNEMEHFFHLNLSSPNYLQFDNIFCPNLTMWLMILSPPRTDFTILFIQSFVNQFFISDISSVFDFGKDNYKWKWNHHDSCKKKINY